MSARAVRAGVACVAVGLALHATARADSVVPPWGDPHDVPLPAWGRSVAPLRPGVLIAAAPGRPDAKRGVVEMGARLPLYGSARGAACGGRWLLVGPMAWVCSDTAEVTGDAPQAASQVTHEAAGAPDAGTRTVPEAQLPFRYFYVGPDGAEAFVNRPSATDDNDGLKAPDETLDPGFAVAITEEADAHGAKWGRTRHGKWVAMRELVPFRASTFRGAIVGDGASLDMAWVVADAAAVFGAPAAVGKPVAKLPRFARITWHEERAAAHGGGAMVRVSPDGSAPEQWMRAKDLAHPTPSAPPDVLGGAKSTASWIDIDVGAQTLVAYEGARPVFATLVSTGLGAGGDPSATPVGEHRVGVKLATSDMENLESPADEADAEDVTTLEDVPFVQYGDHGVALVGTFWHRDFGRPHGRASIDLSPQDAAYVFAFTAPHLPPGWSAAYPTSLEPGTLVRVRTGESIVRDFPVDKSHGTVIHKSDGEPR